MNRSQAGEALYGTSMSETVLNVAAIDDHELSLRGLSSLIDSAADLELAGMFTSVSDLIYGLENPTGLDLVILDLRLADDSNPEENVHRLQSLTHNILVLSSMESPYLVRSALKAGVLGIVQKSELPEVILRAVRAAAHGYAVPSTEWAAAIDSDPQINGINLSERQREVLELYASGEPAKRVARLTGISQETVNDYLGRIRVKYQNAGRPAPTKTDLFRRAQEDGYLPGPSDPRLGEG